MCRAACLSPRGARVENAGGKESGQTEYWLHGGASSRNFETCGNHNFGNNSTPWTLARAKERNPEICHAFWLPSALFCDVPPAHSVGVRKDTLPASPSGEYLFTQSKPGRPKRGLHPQWCRQKGVWPAKRYPLGRPVVTTWSPKVWW